MCDPEDSRTGQQDATGGELKAWPRSTVRTNLTHNVRSHKAKHRHTHARAHTQAALSHVSAVVLTVMRGRWHIQDEEPQKCVKF